MEIQMLKNKADESFSIEQDREAEISRLQEEIKHAGFRVQVLKTEVKQASPKRPKALNSSLNEVLKDPIVDLELQLELTKKEAKEAFEAKIRYTK